MLILGRCMANSRVSQSPVGNLTETHWLVFLVAHQIPIDLPPISNSRSFPALVLSKGLLLSWNICILYYFPPNVPACIFPLWISLNFLGVFLSSLETSSYLDYFSDLPSSMSKLIPAQSLTTSAAHLCFHRVTVLNSTLHFMDSPPAQVRILQTTQANQSGEEHPEFTCLTASVKNQLLFSLATPLCTTWSLDTHPSPEYCPSPLLPLGFHSALFIPQLGVIHTHTQTNLKATARSFCKTIPSLQCSFIFS